MRFAGSRIEGFMSQGPDMGAMAPNAGTIGSKGEVLSQRCSVILQPLA